MWRGLLLEFIEVLVVVLLHSHPHHMQPPPPSLLASSRGCVGLGRPTPTVLDVGGWVCGVGRVSVCLSLNPKAGDGGAAGSVCGSGHRTHSSHAQHSPPLLPPPFACCRGVWVGWGWWGERMRVCCRRKAEMLWHAFACCFCAPHHSNRPRTTPPPLAPAPTRQEELIVPVLRAFGGELGTKCT